MSCEVNINQFLESTYLKTPVQAGISAEETKRNVEELIIEAIKHKFKLVMIRPEFISMAKAMMAGANSYTEVGTVIGFPLGYNKTATKEYEAIAAQLAEVKLTIGAKTSSTGKIFGSVNSIMISESLEEKGFDIDRKKIMLKDVKEIGTYTALIKLHREVKVDVEFEVVSE